MLALRGLTVFPDQTVHFDIGRPKSIKALETAMKGNQRLLLVPQKDIVVDDPGIQDLYPIGTVVQVKQVLRHQGENLRVLVNGLCRAKLLELTQEEPYLSGLAEAVVEIHSADNAHNQALCREANALYGAYSELLERASQAVQLKMLSSNDPGFLADSIPALILQTRRNYSARCIPFADWKMPSVCCTVRSRSFRSMPKSRRKPIG